MDDLISRQDAIDALECEKTYCTAFRDGYTPINVFEKYNAGLTDGIKALKNLPSAQPDIVRCKDCKHSENWCGALWCNIIAKNFVSKNWFCANGKRREE